MQLQVARQQGPLLRSEPHPVSSVFPMSLLRHRPGLPASRGRLLAHPIYKHVDSPERLRKFMEDHVFAVWDFMSLTKRLQRELTSVSLPWQQPPDATMARFINEIVLAEESDEGPDGVAMSHLELYLAGMAEVGADTCRFVEFADRLASGDAPRAALAAVETPGYVQEFVLDTLACAVHGQTIDVIAFFLYGREDVIPEMFERLLTACQWQRDRIANFAYYLKRHIELDGDDHGPAARRLLERYAGDDEAQWRRAGCAAERAIEARSRLWDGILAAMSAPSARR